jgi:hypothetical protein
VARGAIPVDAIGADMAQNHTRAVRTLMIHDLKEGIAEFGSF